MILRNRAAAVFAAGLFSTLLAAGCEERHGGAGNGPQQGTQGAERGAWGPARGWRLVEVARIGSEAGPDEFGSVVDVALDAAGRVWVADGQKQQIRVFDENGIYVRSIGRKGGGPGEFANISGMEWAPDGRLWVLDGGNARFVVYDSAGRLVATHSRNSMVTTTPWPGRFDRQSRLYDVTGTIRPDASIGTAVVRFSTAGQALDTFHVPRFEPEVFRITRGNAQNRAVTEVVVPFTGTQIWQVDPQGNVWLANTARYRLERHQFRGGVTQIVERAHEPIRVSRAERARMLENYRGFERQGGRIDPGRIPDTYPALNGFLFDDDGNLWVSPTSTVRDGRVLHVIDSDGRYLGPIAFPAPALASVKTIRGSRLAAVARDSLDVQSVIVMRIEKPAP